MMKKAGTTTRLILEEVDKMSIDFRAILRALLEVLDPDRTFMFVDLTRRRNDRYKSSRAHGEVITPFRKPCRIA